MVDLLLLLSCAVGLVYSVAVVEVCAVAMFAMLDKIARQAVMKKMRIESNRSCANLANCSQ